MLRKVFTVALLLCAVVALTGCMPKMTIEEMKAQMPSRPVELDRLNDFVGKWQSEGVAKFAMLDQPLKMSGTWEAEWQGDKWYLVSRGMMKMEHFDEVPMLETWAYDIHAKKYRSMWVDGMGMMGTSESRYDDNTRTWHMTARSHSPWGDSRMKGTARFIDENTMDWSMTECQGLMKTMEASGTAKRMR